jgi:hypothetical protein
MKSVVLLAIAISAPLAAQWLNYPDSRIPRTKDGRPNLTAAAPRLNGKPDLSGLWQAERTPQSELAADSATRSWDCKSTHRTSQRMC